MTIHEPTETPHETHETHGQPFAHPYRSPVDPYALDSDGLRVPYRGETRMRLALSSGLSLGRIAIDPAARDLVAIQCDGLLTQLRVVAGEVALSWRMSFGEWLRGAIEPRNRDVAIVLHPAVEWTLAIRGGLAHSEIDLSAGTVARIDISGGCSDVRFELPLPRTAVPVRISGGASQLVVQRPAEAGVTLATSGGMSALRLDDQRFDAIGGSARLDTRNTAPGAPCYELQISGGASDLAIQRRELSR